MSSWGSKPVDEKNLIRKGATSKRRGRTEELGDGVGHVDPSCLEVLG